MRGRGSPVPAAPFEAFGAMALVLEVYRASATITVKRMDTLQDIERAIDSLTPEQREELFAWLDQHHSQSIDAQLKADLDAGRIDSRIRRAVADHKARETRAL